MSYPMLKCSLDSKKRSSCHYPPYGLGPSTVYGTVPGISLDGGLPLLVCMLQATRSLVERLHAGFDQLFYRGFTVA